MMSTEDFLTSLKSVLYDRTASPLAGTWALSWSVWNFKFWLIAFSGADIWVKLGMLELHVFAAGRFNHLVWYPLASTIAIIVVYPFFSWSAYLAWATYQAKLRDAKYKLDKTKRLDQKESQQLIVSSELANERANKLQSRNTALAEEVRMLNEKLGEAQNQASKPAAATPISEPKKIQRETGPAAVLPGHLDPKTTTSSQLARSIESMTKIDINDPEDSPFDANGNPKPGKLDEAMTQTTKSQFFLDLVPTESARNILLQVAQEDTIFKGEIEGVGPNRSEDAIRILLDKKLIRVDGGSDALTLSITEIGKRAAEALIQAEMLGMS